MSNQKDGEKMSVWREVPVRQSDTVQMETVEVIRPAGSTSRMNEKTLRRRHSENGQSLEERMELPEEDSTIEQGSIFGIYCFRME